MYISQKKAYINQRHFMSFFSDEFLMNVDPETYAETYDF